MGFINFGNRIKHRRFDYVPRYYDQEKEEREVRISQYANADKLSDTEIAKSRIRAGFRQKYRAQEDAYASRNKKRSNRILFLVMVLLIITCYIFFTQHFDRLVAFLE